MIKFPLIILLVFKIFFPSSPCHSQPSVLNEKAALIIPLTHKSLDRFALNKIIPEEIRETTLLALSHFPELLDVAIDFQFHENINGSVMQAQPKIGSLLFNNKSNRSYRIKISRYLNLYDEKLPIEELPGDVLLGWLGHELGHIMDYLNRSSLNLISFGVQYLSSKKFVTKAEVTADRFSVAKGLGDAIIVTKDFVLNHEGIPTDYQNKIRSLYLSPGEILSMVDMEEGELD